MGTLGPQYLIYGSLDPFHMYVCTYVYIENLYLYGPLGGSNIDSLASIYVGTIWVLGPLGQ